MDAPTEPELKFERFKAFLMSHATNDAEKEVLEHVTFPVFMTLAASFAAPHYMDLHRFASDKTMHSEEEAHKWVRDFVASGKGSHLFASHLMLHQQKASAEDIVKCVRYLEYFCRIIFERFDTKPKDDE